MCHFFVLLGLVFSGTGVCAVENLTNLAQFIKDFSHLYSNKFVILIKPDDETVEGVSDLIQVQSVFSRSLEFYTSVLDFARFSAFNGEVNRDLGMTTVYIHVDSMRIPEMNAMLGARHNLLLTWLCEIPSNDSISKLRDVYVPLDAKFFLVNWAEEGRAEIQEMYNLPRTEIQEVRYFGEWDDRGGLTTGDRDLTKRRENLKGVTLKYLTYTNG